MLLVVSRQSIDLKTTRVTLKIGKQQFRVSSYSQRQISINNALLTYCNGISECQNTMAGEGSSWSGWIWARDAGRRGADEQSEDEIGRAKKTRERRDTTRD